MTDPFAFAAIVGRITVWQASLPDPKPECFDCQTLTRHLGTSMKQLHGPLMVLGWNRAEVWHRANGKRVRRVYYATPGKQVPRPPRGRPAFRLEDYLSVNFEQETHQ